MVDCIAGLGRVLNCYLFAVYVCSLRKFHLQLE